MSALKLSFDQLTMLRTSGFDWKDGCGFGVQMMSARNWRTARSLEKRKLGWIQGGRPNGSELPGYFFANQDGTSITHPDKLEEFLERARRF